MIDDNIKEVLNDDDQEQLWERIKSKKNNISPPTINALFKYSQKERDVILYNMYTTAKENITKLAELDTKYKDNFDYEVNKEADRLLAGFLKAN